MLPSYCINFEIDKIEESLEGGDGDCHRQSDKNDKIPFYKREQAEADHPIGLIGLSLGPRASGGPRACQKKMKKREKQREKKTRQ